LVLHRRGQFTVEPDLFVRIGRIVLSAAAMGAAMWFLAPLGTPYYRGGALERVAAITLLILAGSVVYFGLAWLTGAIDRTKIGMLTRRAQPKEATP
jgi:putative peptidoglycan lipid II flippase